MASRLDLASTASAIWLSSNTRRRSSAACSIHSTSTCNRRPFWQRRSRVGRSSAPARPDMRLAAFVTWSSDTFPIGSPPVGEHLWTPRSTNRAPLPGTLGRSCHLHSPPRGPRPARPRAGRYGGAFPFGERHFQSIRRRGTRRAGVASATGARSFERLTGATIGRTRLPSRGPPSVATKAGRLLTMRR
jgi:hypothetical protein